MIVLKMLDELEDKLLSKNSVKQLYNECTTEYDRGMFRGKIEMINTIRGLLTDENRAISREVQRKSK